MQWYYDDMFNVTSFKFSFWDCGTDVPTLQIQVYQNPCSYSLTSDVIKQKKNEKFKCHTHTHITISRPTDAEVQNRIVSYHSTFIHMNCGDAVVQYRFNAARRLLSSKIPFAFFASPPSKCIGCWVWLWTNDTRKCLRMHTLCIHSHKFLDTVQPVYRSMFIWQPIAHLKRKCAIPFDICDCRSWSIHRAQHTRTVFMWFREVNLIPKRIVGVVQCSNEM